jgi:hypothetical protein
LENLKKTNKAGVYPDIGKEDIEGIRQMIFRSKAQNLWHTFAKQKNF